MRSGDDVGGLFLLFLAAAMAALGAACSVATWVTCRLLELIGFIVKRALIGGRRVARNVAAGMRKEGERYEREG